MFWLEKAASSAEEEAVFRYAAVLSVSGDKRCVDLLRKLDEDGFFPASYELGGHYYAGAHVTKDIELANKFWKKAADRGHILAKINIIKCNGNSQTLFGRLAIRAKVFGLLLKVARIANKKF